MTGHAFGFAATYALHSSVGLAAALLATAWIRSPSWREVVLRAALFGSLVTSAAALAAPDARLVDRWTLSEPVTLFGSGALRLPFWFGDPGHWLEQRRSTAVGSRAGRGSVPGWVAAGREVDWSKVAVGIWAAGALLLLGRLLLQHALLRGRLSRRREIRSGPPRELLTALCVAEGVGRRVRLSEADTAGVPFALGRSEVCVPTWFAEALRLREQRAALAHELAHLIRRDPGWRRLEAVLSAVLFFQPLNRVCAARLRAVAEELCDDAAVRLTGEPLALASCLNTVAMRMQGQHALPSSVPGMAANASTLVARVQRLTRWRDAGVPRRRARLLAGSLTVALAAWAGPAIVVPAEAVAKPGALAGASAWRALPLPEQDRLLARVEVLRRTTAELIAGEPIGTAVVCLVPAADADLPTALRPVRS